MSNTNAISSSFDQRLCKVLEYHLSHALANSTNSTFKYFWCDGILIPDNSQLSKQNIIQNHRIVTKAWMGWLGTTKQELFEMTIVLGEHSLNNLLKDLDLQACLPENNSTDWVEIDGDNKSIQLRLK